MLGYFLAVLIGLSLGLLGGGGSILTVPILVYALNIDAKTSIALSLAIVAVTSLIGVFGHIRNKNIDFKVAGIFTPSAMIGTFLGAKLSAYISGQVQLIAFSIIMLIAAIFMIKNNRKDEVSAPEKVEIENIKLKYFMIIAEGLVVGIITGLVGVGGGFLIVPALVLMTGISMKRAIGTSLLIISLKSFSGFIGYIGIVEIPWLFLLKFTLFSGAGILVGRYLVKFISQKRLKSSFAIFLIFMGIYILYKNKDVLL